MDDKPLCLLALDGGGIRGLSELLILEEIMRRIKHDLEMTHDPLPADFFDLIGGTSTGGLIALLLGRVRLSVPDARKAYVRIAKDVFSVPRYLKKNKFDGQKLEEAVKKLLREQLGNSRGEERMLDRSTPSCKVFVCAVPQLDVSARAGPRLFRTYNVRENTTFDCTIWEASRATSAAPTYFDPISVGDEGEQETFVDGGLGYNNPIEQVLKEARRVFPERKVACVVSIGTGLARVIKFPDSPKTSPLKLINALKDMATESDTTAERVQARFRETKDTYFRFNVDRGLDHIKLEEWENLGEVRTYTTGYIEQNTVSSHIDTVVTALLASKARPGQDGSTALVQIAGSHSAEMSGSQGQPQMLPWRPAGSIPNFHLSVEAFATTVGSQPSLTMALPGRDYSGSGDQNSTRTPYPTSPAFVGPGGQAHFGNTYHNTRHTHSHKSKDLNDVLNSLPVAKDAHFNAYQRQHDPTCFPDTRVDLLQEIYNWAEGESSPTIFWLSGLAGTGKSTVARTVVAKYSQKSAVRDKPSQKCTLGASFFFSRDGGDGGHLRHARRFVTSIAVQLAYNVQPLKQDISDAITKQGEIASQALEEQWFHLVYNPLLELAGRNCQSRYILVVDALDECEDENNIRIILQLLAKAQLLKTVQLRVFLTSRPEVTIRNEFKPMPVAEHTDVILHRISPSIVNRDIRIFLQHKLRRIAEDNYLGADWPEEQIVDQLVCSANGLFIWAATACLFIGEGRALAAGRLSIILKTDSADDSTDGFSSDDSATDDNNDAVAPEKHLDKLYITVLRNSVYMYKQPERKKWRKRLGTTLGAIAVLSSPLPTKSLMKLLGKEENFLNETLNDLHAILDIPTDSTHPLHLHHPSFSEFLLDETRSKGLDFRINERQAHQSLAEQCIQLMSTCFEKEVCSIGRPGVLVAICSTSQPGTLVSEVDSKQVEQHLPPDMQYACLYWIQHLQKSGAQLCDNDRTHQFLKIHLLHWLEALSWMGRGSEGIYAINSLEAIALTSDCRDFHAFIRDMKQFALYGRLAIEKAPLQVYCSALVFAPAGSIVREQFKDRIPDWMRRLPKIEEDWNALPHTLKGHSLWVSSLAFSPDGEKLASASGDRMIKLWDVRSGAMLETLKSHTDHVNTAAFSLDGKNLASASRDKTVKLWDIKSGEVLHTYKGHLEDVEDVAFSPDSKMLASVSRDKTVKLCDTESGAVLYTLESHSDFAKAVAFSPDGKLLASASGDGIVSLWDVKSRAVLRTIKSHSKGVVAVAFSPDSKTLASASYDGTVKLCNTESGAVLCTLKSHSGLDIGIAFSPDGKLLASASTDGVKLWNPKSGAVLRTLGSHSGNARAVAFSPDGKMLATSSWSGAIKLWNIQSEAVLQTLMNNSDGISTVVFSPDGKTMVSGSRDGTVKLWDVKSGSVLQTPEGHLDRVSTMVFSPDGKMLASASNDRTFKLWNIQSGKMLQTWKGHSSYGNILIFSPDSKKLASVSTDTVELRNAGLVVVLTLKGHSGWVYDAVFSPDSKMLATAIGDDTINLWNIQSGALLRTLRGHSDYVWDMVFLLDCKVLISASKDKTVKLWDIQSGAILQTLKGHLDYINHIAVSLDNRILASASWDKTIKLWDVLSRVILRTLKGHLDYIDTITFLLDSRILVSASRDKTVKLWDVQSGAVLQTLNVGTNIRTLSISDDGTSLRTEKGSLPILSHISGHAAISPPRDPTFIFVENDWVYCFPDRILWLPPEHQPSCVAIQRGTVVFGYSSGRVAFMEFAFQS